jgi:hypothetical protein
LNTLEMPAHFSKCKGMGRTTVQGSPPVASENIVLFWADQLSKNNCRSLTTGMLRVWGMHQGGVGAREFGGLADRGSFRDPWEADVIRQQHRACSHASILENRNPSKRNPPIHRRNSPTYFRRRHIFCGKPSIYFRKLSIFREGVACETWDARSAGSRCRPAAAPRLVLVLQKPEKIHPSI